MTWHGEVTSKLTNLSYGFRFGGEIYHNFLGSNDNASRFESTSLLLRDFVISSKIQDMNLGDASNQSFVLAKDSALGGTLLNINSLWFRNSSVGTNGYLAILATRE